jgi:hypothetical protein
MTAVSITSNLLDGNKKGEEKKKDTKILSKKQVV